MVVIIFLSPGSTKRKCRGPEPRIASRVPRPPELVGYRFFVNTVRTYPSLAYTRQITGAGFWSHSIEMPSQVLIARFVLNLVTLKPVIPNNIDSRLLEAVLGTQCTQLTEVICKPPKTVSLPLLPAYASSELPQSKSIFVRRRPRSSDTYR